MSPKGIAFSLSPGINVMTIHSTHRFSHFPFVCQDMNPLLSKNVFICCKEMVMFCAKFIMNTFSQV